MVVDVFVDGDGDGDEMAQRHADQTVPIAAVAVAVNVADHVNEWAEKVIRSMETEH